MPQTAEWRALNPADLLHIADEMRGCWHALAAMSAPNEATTERTLIEPTFALLGWQFLPQQSAETRRRDIPDALLFRTQRRRQRQPRRKTHASDTLKPRSWSKTRPMTRC